jgi:alpha-L-rhamnosidase
MFGQIGAWLYRGLGGIIPDPEAPGFKHSILRPGFPDSLESFHASHKTPYGELTVFWKKKAYHKKQEERVVEVDIEIPDGATATFYAPAGYIPLRPQVKNKTALKWVKVTGSGSIYAGLNKAALSGGKHTFVLQETKQLR